jgi:hypothetical protein
MQQPFLEQFQESEARIGTTTYTGYRDSNGEIIRHGFYCWEAANRSAREEGQCKHGWRDGIWHSYGPAGKLKSQTHYRDGEHHGRETCWYDDGTLKSELDFVANHVKHSRRYHSNGVLKEEAEYGHNDFRDGLCSVWDERGTLIARGIYKDDLPWNGTFIVEEEIQPSASLPTFNDYMEAFLNRRRAIVAFVNGEFAGPAIVADDGNSSPPLR